MGWKDMRFFNYKLLIMGKTVRIVQYFPIGKIFFPSWKKNQSRAKLANLQFLQAPHTHTRTRIISGVFDFFFPTPASVEPVFSPAAFLQLAFVRHAFQHRVERAGGYSALFARPEGLSTSKAERQ